MIIKMFFNNQERKVMDGDKLTKAEVLAGIKTGLFHPLSREVFFLGIPRKEIEAVLPKPNFYVGAPFVPGKGDLSDDDINFIFAEFASL